MAGLLDFFTSTDPAEQAARMQMAQGLLSGGGSSISRLAGGMGAYQQAMAQARKEEEIRRAREQQAQMQALQQQMLQQQMQQQQARAEAEKRAAMTQQTDEGLMRRLAGVPVEQQMPQGQVGPGMPQRNPGIDPRTFLNQGGSLGGLQQAMALSQALAPASSKPLVSKPGDIARDPTTGQMLWQNPSEAKAPNLNDLIIMGPDGKPMVNQMALQAKRELARAGASNISVPVNLGQKGLDNTLKLRGDFRSEPIYKAHQDVLSAHAQITAALQQASPAGDLAGATKLMKILDPGSVVRESELGMAMAASGALDRASNYANMVMTGQKLTPTQRKDFQALSDKLAAESSRLYSAKRKEYSGIVQRNGLNEDDVLGPGGASQTMKTVKRTGMSGGRKVVEYSDGSIEYAD